MAEVSKKINLLVIPSDKFGVGKFRSVDPHTYIQEHYSDEFNVDIVYQLPQENLDKFLSQYDLIHLHKQLDKDCQIMNMIKFLGIPVMVDVDDYFYLGNDHPMSLSAKKEKWHVPIINHLKLADYVTTTTPIYAETLRKYNPNVAVFPNGVNPDESQYTTEKTPSDKLRVGLICGSSHLEDIKLIGSIVPYLRPNVQLVLCGFDTRGTRTIYHKDTGKVERRPIEPKESVWYDYERILTGNYKTISPEHKEFLMKFMAVDDPFVNEPYRRMWTRDIKEYATHYQNVDVLLAPLKENDFNKHKCVVGETLVSTKEGIYKISDIVENKLPLHINTDGTDRNIVNYFKYSNEKTIRLVTKDGYEIEGTSTHRIMINGEWKRLDEFKVGEKIDLVKPDFVQNQYQYMSYPMLLTKNTENKVITCDETMIPHIKLNERWGRFFGYMLGDGNYRDNGIGISCDKRYADVVADIKTLIESIGLHWLERPKRVDKRCNTNKSKEGFGVDIIASSHTLALMCRKYKLFNDYGKNFHIPDIILQSPKSVIKEFLRGLFEADGSVSEDSSVSYTTKSLELAKEVQYLLLGFGMTSHISRVYNKFYNKYYYTVNLRREETDIFAQEIRFISNEKNRKLDAFVSHKISNHHYKMDFTNEIIDIQEGNADVYDIEVEETHEFNANGIISHNSQLKETEAGFTNTALIAQKFGAYTIDLTSMFGFGGVIDENATSILIESRKNHKDWVKYINKLADNPELVDKLKSNLRNFVLENYSLEKICAERVKLYKELVNKKNEE